MNNGQQLISQETTDSLDPPEVPDRITVVEHVYHRVHGQQTRGVTTRYSRELNQKEQPFDRFTQVGEEWQPLEVGWIKRAGLLIVKNKTGTGIHTKPTPEKQAEIDSKILEIKYRGTDNEMTWLIHPGESMRAVPKDVTKLLIRCQYGQAYYNAFILPD